MLPYALVLWCQYIFQSSSIQIMFIDVPSQQPDGQIQQQHNIETRITKDNKHVPYETNKTNNRILKSLISVP